MKKPAPKPSTSEPVWTADNAFAAALEAGLVELEEPVESAKFSQQDTEFAEVSEIPYTKQVGSVRAAAAFLVASGLSEEEAEAAAAGFVEQSRPILEKLGCSGDEALDAERLVGNGLSETNTRDSCNNSIFNLRSSNPLTIPAHAEKYQGKSKSGEIYAFLQRVYAHQPGAEPLNLEYLAKYDFKALEAFRGRRRIAPIPSELEVLTRPDWGTRSDKILAAYNVDLASDQGREQARRLAGAITNKLYHR